MRSEKLIKRVKRAGYELAQPEYLLERFQDKLEQNHSLVKDKDQDLQNENWIGELFFMLNLLAVHLGVDTEKALRNTNRKFENEVINFEKYGTNEQIQFFSTKLFNFLFKKKN
jgi:ATP diphosphatase